MKPIALRLDRLETRLAPVNAYWDGGGADNHWTTAANWVGDVPPNPGDDLVFPGTAQQLTNVNDFAAGTAFGSLQLTGVDYRLSGNAIALAGGIVFQGAGLSGMLTVGLPITLTADQSFNSGGVVYSLTGPINLNGHALTFAGSSADSTIAGDI